MRILRKVAVVVVAWMAGVVPVAAGQPSGGPSGPAAFLQKLTGEWVVEAAAVPGPGMAPVHTQAKVETRMLGERWLVAESIRTVRGREVSSMRIIGQDPASGRVVGAWIDAMQSHLWQHVGKLDGNGASLTLETEGPILGNPERTTSYREVIELVDADHYVVRSMILGPDGEWFEFGRADHRRAR